MFIAVDGIDGAGKTTLVKSLEELLSQFNPLRTKEPTDNSKWGQKLRMAATEGRLPREQELEYFHRDRLHHIENKILPALKSGRIVITDRYVDSMLAFQAQDPKEAEKMYQDMVHEILIPDVTFILDCPVSVGLKRIRERDGDNLTHFETQSTLERAQTIYKSREGQHYEFIDSSVSPENTLNQAICALVRRSGKIESALAPIFDISVCNSVNKATA